MKASLTALLLLGWVTFAVSFFLPAFITNGEKSYSGWEAFRAALDGTGAFPTLSASTNFLIPLSLGMLWARRGDLRGMYLLLLAAALLLNTWWFVGYPDDRDGLGPGYYLWLASYLLVILGVARLRGASTR